jgi:hypothetical protein
MTGAFWVSMNDAVIEAIDCHPVKGLSPDCLARG